MPISLLEFGDLFPNRVRNLNELLSLFFHSPLEYISIFVVSQWRLSASPYTFDTLTAQLWYKHWVLVNYFPFTTCDLTNSILAQPEDFSWPHATIFLPIVVDEWPAHQEERVVISANYFEDLAVAKLGEVRENKVGAVFELAHLDVVLKFGMIDLPGRGVNFSFGIIVLILLLGSALLFYWFLYGGLSFQVV